MQTREDLHRLRSALRFRVRLRRVAEPVPTSASGECRETHDATLTGLACGEPATAQGDGVGQSSREPFAILSRAYVLW